MAKYLDETGLSKAFELIKGWVTTNFLTDVSYNSTSKKIQKTKNGTTSDVVTLSEVATSGSYNDLDDLPTIPPGISPYTSNPAMDGTASPGSSNLFSRGDHVHPTDTSRAASSHTHGNITNSGDITATAPTVASGDKIIINDESASKITNGPAFGSDTTKYLRNDGTWVKPPNTTYDDFEPPTSSSPGEHGLVPAPDAGLNQNKVLFCDGKYIWDDLFIDMPSSDPHILRLWRGDPVAHASDVVPLGPSAVMIPDASSSTAGYMTTALYNKLSGIAAGAEVNVQSDWNQTTTTADDYIKNKPGNASSSAAGLMSTAMYDKLDGIASGAEVNVQSDWNQTTTTADDYIKNKPTLGTAAAKNIGSVADGNTGLVTGDAVYDAIKDALSDVAGALVYKGTAATASAISGTSYKKGWYWIASATFALTSSINVEPGDMIIAKQDKTSTFANDIDVVQTNIDTLTEAEVTALWNAA